MNMTFPAYSTEHNTPAKTKRKRRGYWKYRHKMGCCVFTFTKAAGNINTAAHSISKIELIQKS